MGRRLTQAGYTVTTYATAQHLLDNLPTGDEPGCIILDVQMPGLAGPALQKRLGELGSTMPIIFLTAYADTRTVVQTLKAGALDFLTKPVASDDLLASGREGTETSPSIARSAAHAGPHSRPHRQPDAARAAGLRTCRCWQHQQADRRHALGCTERTIKAHRLKVMETMQVQTLAELVSLAERVRLLDNARPAAD